MSRPSPSTIALRAYTEKPGSKPVASKGEFMADEVSPWTVVFDTETTIDAAQQLRVGFFQVRKSEALEREGIFYHSKSLTDTDLETVKRYADSHGLEAIAIQAFIQGVFLKYGYIRRGLVVGFNLPFDVSRIAVGHGPAQRRMRGGFSFKLTSDNRDPHVRVKHLNARAALIDFARPAKQEASRGERNRGIKVKAHRGYFLDLKTFAAALTSQSFSLKRLAAFLDVPTQKLETEEHGGPITAEYLDYARADVQASWECLVVLKTRYAAHGLDTEDHRILSEASIGKAYLKQMGAEPLLSYQPEIDRIIFGIIMASYYGGRAEVRIRRTIREVLYCDFKSMYPTVSTLMGMWPFVIGGQFTWIDTTGGTQAFLGRVTLDDLRDKQTWTHLKTLARIRPDNDTLPVRAKYDEKVNTIGLNNLTRQEPLWYTLADCIASKLLSGKSPLIEQALTFDPGPPQQGLSPIDIMGRDDYRVDPNTDDMFRRLIDLRDEAKATGDPVQKALKIVANSTAYGIFVEINRDDAPKPEPLTVFGPNGESIAIESTALEEPGRYFHPLLGTLITGAARLMLALAERLTLDQGLEWVFCDTDSLAIAKPEGMERDEFQARANSVIEWFVPLNPYKKSGSILKIEDINYDKDANALEPLYCFAISAKRYALFNIDKDGNPILRKASAHGLGHLMEPYKEYEVLTALPIPQFPLHEIGVKRWQHDLWVKIIEAALNGHPEKVSYDWHPALQKPALSRYSATSPALLAWMRHYNVDKPYWEQVRPFGFLVSPMARTGLFSAMCDPELVDPHKRGRPRKASEPKPIAPFDTDPGKAVANAFDRETGEPVHSDQLKTYAEVLCQYHLSSENKFENGAFTDKGETWRRHVKADSFVLIGKEANKVGDSGEEEPGLLRTSKNIVLDRGSGYETPLNMGAHTITNPPYRVIKQMC